MTATDDLEPQARLRRTDQTKTINLVGAWRVISTARSEIDRAKRSLESVGLVPPDVIQELHEALMALDEWIDEQGKETSP